MREGMEGAGTGDGPVALDRSDCPGLCFLLCTARTSLNWHFSNFVSQPTSVLGDIMGIRFFLFLLEVIYYFTILYWFCHTSTCIYHRYTCVSHPEPPPSSLPVPSLWVISVYQPQVSSIMHWTWTGYSFHIWYYTCFNAILPNYPTFSHRIQKTVLYTGVSFAVSHTGLSLPSF